MDRQPPLQPWLDHNGKSFVSHLNRFDTTDYSSTVGEHLWVFKSRYFNLPEFERPSQDVEAFLMQISRDLKENQIRYSKLEGKARSKEVLELVGETYMAMREGFT
jgi:hypothetical protein